MTNKKFKIAAMSMALTACVAAQPLMANAAESEETPSPDNTAPSDAAAESTPEPASDDAAQPEAVSTAAEEPKETFGEDVDVKYDPSTKTDGEDGSSSVDGDVIRTEPDAPLAGDETEIIGDAEKTETPEETETEVKPDPDASPIPDETKPSTSVTEPDGSTTITTPTVTPGTETTTTTGSGHAEADTTETSDTKKEDISLKDELGEDPDIDWNVEKDTAIGDTGYKVDEVKNEGNRQTLTLVKETEESGEMTPDDIAKLVDADTPTLNEDGSYTLTRTEKYLDENGDEQTRTTYITVKDSNVTIKTKTVLTVTREKTEHKPEQAVSASNDFHYPDIPLTDSDTGRSSGSISSSDLDKMISDANKQADGTYRCSDGDREYTITVDREAAGKLTAKEIADKLGSDYTYEGDKVYYIGNGQHAELSVDQTNVIREKLSIKVEVREKTKGDTITIGKNNAETDAKNNAVKDALNNAVDDLLKNEKITQEEADELKKQIIAAAVDGTTGGTFKAEVNGKKFELDYTKGTITSTDAVNHGDTSDSADNTDFTVNGEAFVTGGSASWSESESDFGVISGRLDEGIRKDFSIPEGVTPVTKDGKTTYTYERDGKIYEMTYSAPTEEQQKQIENKLREKGLDDDAIKAALAQGDFQWVSWNVAEKQSTEDSIENVDLRKGDRWTFDDKTGTLNITYANGDKESYSDLTYDPATGTYTGTDPKDSSKSYEIKEGSDPSKKLTRDEIRELLKKDYGDVTFLDDNTVTYQKDGKTYTLKFSNPGESSIRVTTSTKTTLTDADEDTVRSEIEKKLGELKDGEELLVGNQVVTKKNGELWLKDAPAKTTEITKIINDAVHSFVNYDDLSEDELADLLKDLYQDAIDSKDIYGNPNQRFDHADLTISTTLTDEKGNVIDENALIIGSSYGQAPEFRHSSDVDTIVSGGGIRSNIASRITSDNGRQEYQHTGSQEFFGNGNYYSLSGKVVYGHYESYDSYLQAAANANGKTIVQVGGRYRVYDNTADLSAYGYMDKSSNGCTGGMGGSVTNPPLGSKNFGYDLKVNDLILVNGKVVAQSKTTYSATLTKRTTRTNAFEALNLISLSHKNTFSGNGYKGSYDVSAEQEFNWKNCLSDGISGTGEGTYNSFREWLRKTFTGCADDLQKDTGSFTYSYTTESDLEAVSKSETVTKHAEVDYAYKTIETRDVLIPGETVIRVTPDDPTPPVTPTTPETPVIPDTPDLPPVQDISAPGITVLPAAPAMPTVQAAHALPQTGVNWMTAICLAVSGFALTAAGAFASLTGKNARH